MTYDCLGAPLREHVVEAWANLDPAVTRRAHRQLGLFFLDRIDRMQGTSHLERPVSEYLRSNVFVTPGGIFSTRYLHWALDVIGADRIMFAADYPYAAAGDGAALRFLDGLDADDQDKIASGHWDQLCAGIRR